MSERPICAKCKREKDYRRPFTGSGVFSMNFENHYLCHECSHEVYDFIFGATREGKRS